MDYIVGIVKLVYIECKLTDQLEPQKLQRRPLLLHLTQSLAALCLISSIQIPEQNLNIRNDHNKTSSSKTLHQNINSVNPL